MEFDLGKARGPFAGTPGHLDAPYAATPPEVVEAMLELAALAPGDRLLDLGSGDGRIAIEAARRGAEAFGVDIDPQRVMQAEQAARAAGVEARARFRREDLFATPLGEADVITMYLLAHVNVWLGPRLRAEARPGTRIVSYAYPISGWEPAATRKLPGWTTLYLWIA